MTCRYLNDFETALYSSSFTDPAKGWRQYANETAWVDWFLSIELIRNVKHSYHSSAFLQKVACAFSAMHLPQKTRTTHNLSLLKGKGHKIPPDMSG